jgi:adenylyltransferase and sulfurtransferase
VLDCTDNPATRYLISDVCVLAGKVLVSGAAQRTEGQLMVLNYPPADANEAANLLQKGPCYRCIFPVPPAPETVQSCAEVGVLGPVVGVIGVLMAMEVVKIIVSTDEERNAWKPSLLLYSGMSKDPRAVWRTVGLRARRKDCLACGNPDVLKEKGKWEERITWDGLRDGRVDYEEFCGRLEDVQLLEREHRVAASQFIEAMEREDARDQIGRWGRERPLVVDVREEAEFALGAKVKGSVNLPLSKILRRGGSRTEKNDDIGQLLGAGEAANTHPVYFVCQKGNDSQVAAHEFLAGVGQGRWVGDVMGGLVALEKHVSA